MEITFVTSQTEWEEILENFPSHDVYHTYEYSNVSRHEGQKIGLLHVTGQYHEMVWPLVIIETELDGETVRDLGSAYGYPGPLFLGDWTESDLSLTWEGVAKYFSATKIVSLVSRLNPFSGSNAGPVPTLDSIGEIALVNPVVELDLARPQEEQVKDYRSNHRRDIRRLINNGYCCKLVEPDDYLDSFIGIYTETMERLNAKGEYFFKREYFDRLFNAEKFDTTLFLVFNSQDVPVCGGVFFTTGNTMHYHLGATKTEFLREAPTKLLLDVVRIYACEINCGSFNLGGGVGGGDDSLYRFKAGFSKKSLEYCVFMSVFDQKAYDGLVTRREKIACSSGSELVSSFLPRYRAPIIPKVDTAIQVI